MPVPVAILDAIRVPRGKGRKGGALAGVAPVDLLAQLFNALEERTGLDSREVEEIHLGCVTQMNDQGANIAHTAALYSGWQPAGSASTVSSYCTSGLTATSIAAGRIASGMGDIYVAGGVELMSRVPMLSDNGPLFANPAVRAAVPFIANGVIADAVATREGFDRAMLDGYAARSHQRAAAATGEGRFARSLVPVRDGDGQLVLERDELICPDAKAETMARLAPLFADQGASGDSALLERHFGLDRPIRHDHHAGSAPGIVDGASLVLLASPEGAARLGAEPRGRIADFSFRRGPAIEGLTGAIAATEHLLERSGLAVADIDLWEFNEGFAAIALYFARRFGIDDERFNVNGGGIAMGHAMGATGGNLIGIMLDELERRGLRRGIVAISGAAGAGAAMLIDRPL